MTHISVAGLNGYMGEFSFARLLAACKVSQVEFEDSLHLIEVAKQSQIGRDRIQSAKPYLNSEYGTPIRKPDGKYRIELDWAQVPAKAILDRVYGLDAVVNFRGWQIGIDVTVNPETLVEKRQKLNWLAPLWKKIGIDYVAVILLLLPQKQPDELNQANISLLDEFKKVIKAQKQIIALNL